MMASCLTCHICCRQFQAPKACQSCVEAFPSLAASLTKSPDDGNEGVMPTGPGLPNTLPVSVGSKMQSDSNCRWVGTASGTAVPITPDSHSSRCESSSSTIDIDQSSVNGKGNQEHVNGQHDHGSEGSDGEREDSRPDRDDEMKETKQIDDATLATMLSSHAQFDLARFPDGSRKHLCPVCGKGFKRPVKVRRHLAVHLRIPGTEGQPRQTWRQVLEQETAFSMALGEFTPRACPTCGRYFTESKKYQMHILAHAGRSPYRCDVCKKNFTRSDHLNVHLRTAAHRRAQAVGEFENHQHVKVKQQKDNSNAEDGSIRIVNIQSTGGGSPVSESVQPTCQTELELLIGNSRSKKLPFRKACEQCSRIFINQRNYELHMQAHRGCSPHNCRICDRQFTRSDHLLVHYKTATHRRRLAELSATARGAESHGFPNDSTELEMNHNVSKTEEMTGHTEENGYVQNGHHTTESLTSPSEGFVLETKQEELSPVELSPSYVPFPPQLRPVEHSTSVTGTPIQLHSAAYNSMSTHGASSPTDLYAGGENESGIAPETSVMIIGGNRELPGQNQEEDDQEEDDQEGRYSSPPVSLEAVQRYPVVPYSSEGVPHLTGSPVGMEGSP